MGVEDVAEALVPPGISKSLRWRIAVSLSIAGILIWIAWAMGMLFGLPGLAKADDVKDVKIQLANVQASLIAKDIDGVSTSLCMNNYDPNLLAYRNVLQSQYRAVTGHEHEPPPCAVLLALKR